ncbi:30S ribosomal protein S3ae [Desulfurococcus mucosus]|uniref:Small ribosomal subunit protein eS1 n=1 Tax=Desulfurococcus mucosus (strain ATCC 35584 / DSM 2162 / JCM 9187 / O7/1) TaxID=765177 RepID=E8R7F5_DESM0|nr:30S ribosomal protein S3ae [Desulfurococcus mucosus]ADV65620.1 SSU ribosomal protein S3AE [Desulfurococcus mucosus DSM 2162]
MSSKHRVVVKDKWKIKKWFEVVAPASLGGVSLGTTPADMPEKLIGRVIETTLYDITGDITQVHVKLYLQVVSVEGNKAVTRFKGHELARDYMRSLIRRKSSKIQGIFDVTTKDGYILRLTIVALTSYRCKTSQKRAIRRVMRDYIYKKAGELTLDELIQEIMSYKVSNEISELARKIYPIRRVEVYKSKLLMVPSPEGPKPAVVVSPLQLKAESK